MKYDSGRVKAFVKFVEQNNWKYEQKDNVFQLSFRFDDSHITDKNHIVTVKDDKVCSNVFFGVRAADEEAKAEILKLLNRINTSKIYYGRFVVTDKNEVWFDFSLPLYAGIASNSIYSNIIGISDNYCEHFGDSIFETANQIKTAEEVKL